MNGFLAAALVLQAALVPCALVCWRSGVEHRLVALGLAGTVQSLALLCLAVGYREPGLASLAVVLAALSSGGSVAFARFLERWLPAGRPRSRPRDRDPARRDLVGPGRRGRRPSRGGAVTEAVIALALIVLLSLAKVGKGRG